MHSVKPGCWILMQLGYGNLYALKLYDCYFAAKRAIKTVHFHGGTTMFHILIPFTPPPPPHRYNLSKLDKSRWLISNVNEQTVILLHSVNVRY
jgi:hypothetical protein